MTRAPERVPSQSADRVLRVLSMFLTDDGPLGVSDVSRSLDLDKSVVHRILATLVQHGYVEQQIPSRKYSLGLRAWELGKRYTVRSWLSETAVPLLADVLEQHGSTGYVATLRDTEIVYLATVDGAGPFQVSVDVGSRTSVVTTAIGHAILAGLNPSQLADVLDGIDFEEALGVYPPGALDRAWLEAEIEATRDRGYAYNRGHDRLGVGAVGAAILDGSGTSLAGVSIAFPMMSEYEYLWDLLAGEVCNVAREVSRRL
ncbi:MAG: IclR family transcriptional regulator [Acidimicrobiales bacterium]